MISIYNVYGVLIVVYLFVMFRLHVTHKIRMKAIGIVGRRSIEAASRGEKYQDYWALYDNSKSRSAMFWSLTRWRFKDFYPSLA